MNRQFPALRGVAIILVVLNHTIAMGTNYPLQNGVPPVGQAAQIILDALSGIGLLAVPIFLFLSGCFFAYAARGDDIRANYKIVRVNLKPVLIPYLIWSILFYIELWLLHDGGFSLTGWVKNLIVGYPFNFIPLLVFYYLIAPLLIWLNKRIGWFLVLLIGLYQLFLINVIHPGTLGFQLPGWAGWLTPPVLARTMADWAIFFPLGLVYVLNAKSVMPLLQRLKWIFVVLTVVLYAVALLNQQAIIDFPIARFLFPVTFIFITPTIKRDSIPWVRQFEMFGKRAYGLYLMNLLVLDLILLTIQTVLPGLFSYQLILMPFLFVLALAIPMAIMRAVERLPKPGMFRLIFG
jgi:peptidoglycan/LPS O-acetylase OafA/YrhL